MKTVLLFASLAFLHASGCKKAAQTSAPTASAPSVGGKRYAVRVDAAASTIRITPEGGWKMNLEYDHRFEGTLRPAGTAVKLEKAAAKVSEQEVSFAVTAKPGDTCEGSVFFAICTKSTCVPVEEKVSFTIAAK